MTRERTVVDWVERVAGTLQAAGLHFGHGTDNATDEAVWLVLHALGEAEDGSFEEWRRLVTPDQALSIEQLTEARCGTGKPLAYLLGEAWFAGLPFEVNESVLVPRSPIAELVIDGFRPWVTRIGSSRVLDLCCGSGCIGIAIAAHAPGSRVELADISPDALEVARRNAARHRVVDRVGFIESDLFKSLEGRRYDLIVSNPPYVPADAHEDLPREYRAEPRIGLVSGEDGLDAPLAILLDAPRHLCEDGVLVCEVGESEAGLVDLLPRVPFTWLEFAHGGSGVFVLDREQLREAAPAVSEAIGKRSHVT
ncbi:MAG: 50S ribosomal protein L3 N(5)-glutamine methyltransferase [Gammaproteobacteria bacterium]|nr:50S ribosomal protein L3 N(5)-glutamine methyltransferase [Gammaproteobacteria bacterium]